MIFQTTLKRSAAVEGVGLHSGTTVHLQIHPAPANTGIRFVRSDRPDAEPLAADVRRVSSTSLATSLCGDDFCVATVEHLMSALAGLGVDNALVELDADELPIMDGSAVPFVRAIRRAGIRRQAAARRYLMVTSPVTVHADGKRAALYPARDFRISYVIQYEHPVIRTQNFKLEVTPLKYEREIAPARTFGFLKDVQMLQQNGFAVGGSLDNVVVVGQRDVLNSEGLRFPEEFVRHKILDAIGDLYLLGMPLLGHFVGHKSGHGLHTMIARKLLARPGCYRVVEFGREGEREIAPAHVPSLAAAQ